MIVENLFTKLSLKNKQTSFRIYIYLIFLFYIVEIKFYQQLQSEETGWKKLRMPMPSFDTKQEYKSKKIKSNPITKKTNAI